MRTSRPVFLLCLLVPGASFMGAQTAPLPDIPTLMHQVEEHQREAEAVRKDYTYRSSVTLERLDNSGHIKDVDSRISDIFYLNGVPVERTLEHNGKPLSPSEQKKQDDKIDREVAKARERLAKANASGRPTDSAGNPVITVSRLLQLGRFTDPRRVEINGRPTIVVDFTGDPNAKTHDAGESVVHDMAGTLWIDEQDRAIEHLTGTFVSTFKLGGGLLADISKGTTFSATNTRVNNEIWLPATAEAHGHIRFLLFFNLDGHLSMSESNYRKFKVTSTILPPSVASGGSALPAPCARPCKQTGLSNRPEPHGVSEGGPNATLIK